MSAFSIRRRASPTIRSVRGAPPRSARTGRAPSGTSQRPNSVTSGRKCHSKEQRASTTRRPARMIQQSNLKRVPLGHRCHGIKSQAREPADRCEKRKLPAHRSFLYFNELRWSAPFGGQSVLPACSSKGEGIQFRDARRCSGEPSCIDSFGQTQHQPVKCARETVSVLALQRTPGARYDLAEAVGRLDSKGCFFLN
jgi:hypothetical protein